MHEIDLRYLRGKPWHNGQSAKLKVAAPGVAATQKETHVPVSSEAQLKMLDRKMVTYTLRLFEPVLFSFAL